MPSQSTYWFYRWLVIAGIGSAPAYAQQPIDFITYEITDQTEGDRVTLTYNLSVNEPGLRCNVVPFYLDSSGERQYIRKHLQGSVGDTVSAGQQKKIFWNHYRAFPDGYRGELRIGLAVEVVPPPATVPLKQEQYRRGTRIPIPEGVREPRYFHLLDDERRSYYEGPVASPTAPIRLPADLPLNQTFHIRFQDDRRRTAYTSSFVIRRRIPLAAVIATPVLIAGGILYFILQEDPLPLPAALPESN